MLEVVAIGRKNAGKDPDNAPNWIYLTVRAGLYILPRADIRVLYVKFSFTFEKACEAFEEAYETFEESERRNNAHARNYRTDTYE